MDDLVGLEKPVSQETFMIAGWHQWADAGSISSELPRYLIEHTGARKIGEIRSRGFYLFQIPGTHDLLRPKIKLNEGHRQHIEQRQNEFYYTGNERKGLVLFAGHEPHHNVERYASAFLDAVEALSVKRVAVVAGVNGPVPYDRDREVSCVYSLPRMKADLARYAVKLSNYEGGSSIGTYLAHRAQERGIEFVAFYAFVPFYDFGPLATRTMGIQIENDFRAWYELMRRLNHMFGVGIDLATLERKSNQLVSIVDAQIDELDQKVPQLNAREQIENVTRDFEEVSFMPLSEVWERELKDLFDDEDAL